MAIGNIGGISVKITAEMEGFKAAINRVNSSVSDTARRLKNSSRDFQKWSAVAVASATAVGAAIIKATASNIQELKTFSQVANTSAQDFQRLAYAAKLNGVEQDKLADILKDVNDRLGDFKATGGGAMADFFENIAPKVGVTYENFRKLSGKDALQLYVSSLERANLSQADMTFYMEAIASDSTRLLPLLKNNGQMLGVMAAEAERLGLVLSDIEINKLEAANREFLKAQFLITAAAQRATVELAPVIVGISNAFSDAGASGQTMAKSITGAFSGAVKVVGVMADGVHGISVLFSGLKVGAMAMSKAVNEAMRVMTVGMEQFVNLGIAGINKVIEAANSIPGVGIPAVESFTFSAATMFRNLSASASENLTNAIQEFHNKAMEPIPSERLNEWVTAAQEATQKAAEAMSGTTPDGTGGDSSGLGLSPEDRKALDEKIAAIQESLLTEQQLRAESYLKDLEAINLKRQNDLENKEYWDQLERDLAKKHQQELIDIEAAAAEKRKRLQDMEARQKLNAVASMFGNLSSLMNTQSRKLFEIGKAGALAQAVISGLSAIQQTWENNGGFPYAIPAAAAMTAKHLANVAAISRTQYGSAGVGQSYAGGQVATNTTPAQQQQPQTTMVDLRVTGNGGIIDMLNFEIENGGQIINAGG